MRALVIQLLEALDESRGDVSQCLQEELPKAGYERYDRRIKAITEQLEKHDAAIKAAREYLATEPSGERAELIARLNECLSGPATLTTREATAIKDAADMLEADADLRTQLARRTVERDMAISMIGDCIDEQQVKRVPMTDGGIAEISERMEASDPTDSFWREFARAIEAHHGITPADKPTGWDNGLSQDYCAEFGQWLASRPGARQQIKEMFDEPEEEDLYALALKADNWGQP